MINKEVLFQKYVNENKTFQQIGLELGKSISHICVLMKKYNIPARKNTNLDKVTKELLYTEYVINNLSIITIAKKIGCSSSHIKNKLKQYNIPCRSNSRLGRQNKDLCIHADLTGLVFGFLSVKSYIKHKGWQCQCQRCGNFTTARTGHLTQGRKISCGCLILRKGIESPRWKGYKDIPGRILTRVYSNARRRNGRKLLVDIDLEYIWEFFQKQNKKCALSGIPLAFSNKSSENTASIDRIDSSKGYIKGNIQVVHKRINEMKMSDSSEDFINWCNLVSKHRP